MQLFSSLVAASLTKAAVLPLSNAPIPEFSLILAHLDLSRYSRRAAFVWVPLCCPSRWPRGWLDVADGRKDLPEEFAGDSHLGQLEGDLAGVAHDPVPRS